MPHRVNAPLSPEKPTTLGPFYTSTPLRQPPAVNKNNNNNKVTDVPIVLNFGRSKESPRTKNR
jgi:hypothetical protein